MRIISGSFGGRALRTAEGPGYRPATSKVRGAVFSMLESRDVVWGGTRVLDLFAGSGSLGFEALSRGALEACFVEKAPPALAAIRRSAESFELLPERCRIVGEDVARFLRPRPAAPFNVVFIDPPYGENRLAPTLKSLIKNDWIAEAGFVLAEVEHRLRNEAVAADPSLSLDVDRVYGQTRILLWQYHSA